MTHQSFADRDWREIVARLGGANALETSARETKAFRRARGFKSAADLLRLILAYCLGQGGLRLTVARASALGLADVSNVALLYRLRQSVDWLAFLIGQALARAAPKRAKGRFIRILDATSVPKAGARRSSRLWRIHSAFDLPGERFGAFELTDEKGGERLDRLSAVKGEIRIADRAYLQPGRMAAVLEAGADLVVRAGWRQARWLDAKGEKVDLIAELRKAQARGLIDKPIFTAGKSGAPLKLRLVAVRKPGQAQDASRRKARRKAQQGGHRLSQDTLAAAEWVILVTSLKPEAFSADEVLALYRLRWRIELAFKRLKSVVGLHGPPGAEERCARAWVLAHLLMILLLEPLLDAFEDSPRQAAA